MPSPSKARTLLDSLDTAFADVEEKGKALDKLNEQAEFARKAHADAQVKLKTIQDSLNAMLGTQSNPRVRVG